VHLLLVALRWAMVQSLWVLILPELKEVLNAQSTLRGLVLHLPARLPEQRVAGKRQICWSRRWSRVGRPPQRCIAPMKNGRWVACLGEFIFAGGSGLELLGCLFD
jgi:hypothetical protein